MSPVKLNIKEYFHFFLWVSLQLSCEAVPLVLRIFHLSQRRSSHALGEILFVVALFELECEIKGGHIRKCCSFAVW